MTTLLKIQKARDLAESKNDARLHTLQEKNIFNRMSLIFILFDSSLKMRPPKSI